MFQRTNGNSDSCKNDHEVISGGYLEFIGNSAYKSEINFMPNVSGILWCIVQNETESGVYIPFNNFENEVSITIQVHNMDKEITQGDEVEISCSVPMNFCFKHFKWFYNKQMISPNDEIKISGNNSLNSTKTILRFPNIDYKHNGLYTCQIYNDSESIEISVFQPQLDSNLTNDIMPVDKKIGDSFKVDCILHGRPRPNITWCKHNYTSNTWSVVANTNSLHIPTVR